MTEQEAIKALKEHKEIIDKEYIKTRNSKAIEVVLNALKEKDKIIEKLREDNTIFALEGSRVALKLYIENNYIPVQKVKDKIEYLDKQQKQWLEDRELKASDSEIIFARDVLQELLEGRK